MERIGDAEVEVSLKQLRLTCVNDAESSANPESILSSMIAMFELSSCPVYLKSTGVNKRKSYPHAIASESDHYLNFIDRSSLAMAVALVQSPSTEASTVKVLTSAGVGML